MNRRRAAPPKRGWQRMLSGRRLEILDPSPLDVELDDIAHGIARVARWNGQTRGPFPYSVAQHCCLVEALGSELAPDLDEKGRLTLLLHDASEYVVGDLVTPLKAALGEPFKVIEARLQSAIFLAFGLPAEPPDTLRHLSKRADQGAAWLEATTLAGFSRDEANRIFGPSEPCGDVVAPLLDPWPADFAERTFRMRVQACLQRKQAGHRAVL